MTKLAAINRLWGIWAYTAGIILGVAALPVICSQTRQVVDLQLIPQRSIMYCAPDTDITVLTADPAGVRLNRKTVVPGELGRVLAAYFERRAAKMVYIVAAPELTYGDLIRLVDTSRGAGVKVFVLGLPGRCDPNGAWPWTI